jgi:hypothetical protein
MANSRYPVTVGAKNGGNGAQLRALRSGMGWAWGPAQWWSEIFDITRAGALDADTDQTFDLHTYNPNNLFPANVFRGPALLRPLTNVGGGAISAVTAQLGDTNDTDGLVTASAVHNTAGTIINTVGAAEYASRVEAAFIPTLRLVFTGGNAAAATAGRILCCILFRPIVAV